jgi:DUF4097 and DUF4098 domain-containing protein YvlB
VRVTSASGRVTITAEPRADIVASAGRDETRSSGVLDLDLTTSSDRIDVRCPLGTEVVVGSASGRVTLAGELGAARINAGSGSIEVESVASADLRTQSGRIAVGRCAGSCRVMNKSGRVEIGQAGEIHVESVSGRVEVSGDDVHVRTVSGRVEIDMNRRAAVDTVSGRIEVRVPAGFRPAVLSQSHGRVHVDVPQGSDGEISVRTVSGAVRVRSR